MGKPVKSSSKSGVRPAPHTRVLHRHSHSDLPVAAGGDGPYVIDTKGNRYLDASGGAAVSCLGHSDQDVIAAVQAQIGEMPFAHSAFFTNKPMEQLADLMVDGAPEGLDRVYFTSGGSEAIEAALKMARQYFIEIGQPERTVFIARRQSYHGNTLGALSVGGNEWRRAPFREIMAETGKRLDAYAGANIPDGVPVRHIVAHGRIYEEIIKTADGTGIDLIVMSAQRPDFGDYLLGPNAARVARHAKQSVLIVR